MNSIYLILRNKGGNTMKFKLTVILATFVVTIGLLLGASAGGGNS
jgi:hypothetical protein